MLHRIVITRPLPGDPVGWLREAGFSDTWIFPEDRMMTRRELLDAIPGAHAVLATPADVDVNDEFFDAAGEQLVIVSNYAVGVDNIDLAAASRRGIIVGHTPHAVTEPTADIAWVLLLGAAKRAWEGQSLIRNHTWAGIGPCFMLGQRVIGKKLFIVGAGRIGYATARRALGWEMEILYHARTQHEEFEGPPMNGRRVSLEDGLREADFVSVHTPLSEETRHLINAERLAMMKPTAILINTARGAVVDEAALVEALRNKQIYAAGLDVFENEPKTAPGLAELDNCYLLPHLGSATVEDREWMARIATDNIIAALRGEPIPHAYPLPAVV